MWNKLPRWALVMVLSVTLLPAGYAVSEHLRADTKQSDEIDELHDRLMELTMAVDNMMQVVEYNYKETERNTNDVRKIRDTQMRIEILLARIEERLDKDASS